MEKRAPWLDNAKLACWILISHCLGTHVLYMYCTAGYCNCDCVHDMYSTRTCTVHVHEQTMIVYGNGPTSVKSRESRQFSVGDLSRKRKGSSLYYTCTWSIQSPLSREICGLFRLFLRIRCTPTENWPSDFGPESMLFLVALLHVQNINESGHIWYENREHDVSYPLTTPSWQHLCYIGVFSCVFRSLEFSLAKPRVSRGANSCVTPDEKTRL